ncbi:MAG: NAD-dependent epimerase/dehydratase family protein [Candidatus Binataceae bacterium]
MEQTKHDIQRVLVTGHAGYIGAVMTPMLRHEGFAVTGLDTFFFAGCDLGELGNPIPELRLDLRDVRAADLAGFDAIIHLGALSNDPLGDLQPDLTWEINHLASVALARAARAAGVRRFLYSSSCSIYGASGSEPLTEEAPFAPLTPYAGSKVRAEEDLAGLASRDFSPVYLRNATAYGFSPRLRADVVLNNLVCWAFTTGKIRILSDGTPWRPLVHVADIAHAFIAALRAPAEVIHNQAFNVGSNDQNYQVRDIAEIVRAEMPACQIEYGGVSGPDPRNYRVDFSKIDRLLPEFRTHWDARSGARELREAFERHGLTAEDFQGRRFTRLAQLKFLLESRRVDAALRWNDRGATPATCN